MTFSLSANASEENIVPTNATPRSRGLTALLIGGAVLIVAVWWVVMQLSSTLARIHVEQRMADIAAKAQDVLRQARGTTPDARLALRHLARFRDITHMELRDANGALLWRNHQTPAPKRLDLPTANATLLEKRNIDGLSRDWARHHALFTVAGQLHHLLLEADVTTILASYRYVALLVAKAFTTVLLAAIFLMGWLLMRRQRLEAEQLSADDWRAELETLQTHNAQLLRRMTQLTAAAKGETKTTEHITTAEEKRRHA